MNLNKYNNYSLLKENNVENFIETLEEKTYPFKDLERRLYELKNEYINLFIGNKYVCINANGDGRCKEEIGRYFGNVFENTIIPHIRSLCVYDFDEDNFKVLLKNSIPPDFDTAAVNAYTVYKSKYYGDSAGRFNSLKSKMSDKTGEIVQEIINNIKSLPKAFDNTSYYKYNVIYNGIKSLIDTRRNNVYNYDYMGGTVWLCRDDNPNNNNSLGEAKSKCLGYVDHIYYGYFNNIMSTIANNLIYTDEIIKSINSYIDDIAISGILKPGEIDSYCDSAGKNYTNSTNKNALKSRCKSELPKLKDDIKMTLYSNKALSIRVIKEIINSYNLSSVCSNNNCDSNILNIIYNDIYNNILNSTNLTIDILLSPINKQIFDNYYNEQLKEILRNIKTKIMNNSELSSLDISNFTNTTENFISGNTIDANDTLLDSIKNNNYITNERINEMCIYSKDSQCSNQINNLLNDFIKNMPSNNINNLTKYIIDDETLIIDDTKINIEPNYKDTTINIISNEFKTYKLLLKNEIINEYNTKIYFDNFGKSNNFDFLNNYNNDFNIGCDENDTKCISNNNSIKKILNNTSNLFINNKNLDAKTIIDNSDSCYGECTNQSVNYSNNEKHEFLYNCKNNCNNKIFDIVSNDYWTYSNNSIDNPIANVYNSINDINRKVLQPQTFNDDGSVKSGDASVNKYKLSSDNVFETVSASLDDKTNCELLPYLNSNLTNKEYVVSICKNNINNTNNNIIYKLKNGSSDIDLHFEVNNCINVCDTDSTLCDNETSKKYCRGLCINRLNLVDGQVEIDNDGLQKGLVYKISTDDSFAKYLIADIKTFITDKIITIIPNDNEGKQDVVVTNILNSISDLESSNYISIKDIDNIFELEINSTTNNLTIEQKNSLKEIKNNLLSRIIIKLTKRNEEVIDGFNNNLETFINIDKDNKIMKFITQYKYYIIAIICIIIFYKYNKK